MVRRNALNAPIACAIRWPASCEILFSFAASQSDGLLAQSVASLIGDGIQNVNAPDKMPNIREPDQQCSAKPPCI
jgi:hypothetical protein